MPRSRRHYNPISSADDGDVEQVEQVSQDGTEGQANDTASGVPPPDHPPASGVMLNRNVDNQLGEGAPLKPTESEESDSLDDDDGERVTVVVLDSAQTKFPIRANPNWTVQQFKKVGENVHKVAPASQRLIFRGRMLADSDTLRESGITHDNVIVHLFPKPRVVVTSSSNVTDTSSAAENDAGGGRRAHVPQIILDEEEAGRRGQILVLGSAEIAEAQNNVKLLSLLLLVVCSMRLLALFSIAMGVSEDPSGYNDDSIPHPPSPLHNHTDDPGFPNNQEEYQTRPWETPDYFDLAVSAIGFYVATLGMKATTENTLQLANAYMIGTVIAGIGWNLWNVFMYIMFYREETAPKPEDDENSITLTRDDFATVAFFTVFLPLMVWGLCCARAWQFRQLLEEAEQEAAERIRSQLTLQEGGIDGNAREMTEISSNRPSVV